MAPNLAASGRLSPTRGISFGAKGRTQASVRPQQAPRPKMAAHSDAPYSAALKMAALPAGPVEFLLSLPGPKMAAIEFESGVATLGSRNRVSCFRL